MTTSILVGIVIPIALIVIYVIANPYSKKSAFNYLQKYCPNSEWLYNRIYISNSNVDIAFIGSSLTMCSVNDSLIELELSKRINQDIHVANLAFCHYGRNLDYLLAKESMTRKKPQLLILEIRQNEARFGHIYYPYIGNFLDILTSTEPSHKNKIKSLRSFVKSRVSYYKNQLSFNSKTQNSDRPFEKFSYKSNSKIAEPQKLEEVKVNHLGMLNNKIFTNNEKLMNSDAEQFSKTYVSKIASLALINNTTVICLYMPYFGTSHYLPRNIDYYKSLGCDVWLPPDSLFQNPNHMSDSYHMNFAGSSLFSKWLIEELAIFLTTEIE